MELQDKNSNDKKNSTKFATASHIIAATARTHRVAPTNSDQKKRRASRSLRISTVGSNFPGFPIDVQIAEEDGGDQNISLWQAIRVGKISIVNKCLEDENTSVNSKDERGMSALHYAAYYDRHDTAKLLLQRGAVVDPLTPENKMTPLHIAAKQNCVSAAKVLLNFNADAHARDIKGSVPLHIAARQGREEFTKVLLSSTGANPNVCDTDNMTPLHQAALKGNLAVCNLLVQYGADIRAKEVNDITPLMIAAVGGHTDIMSMLLETAKKQYTVPHDYLEDCDNEGNTALHLAISNGHFEASVLCLDNGADVDSRKGNGFSGLHIASVNGYTDIASMLITRGANINDKDEEQMTPLHRAAIYNRVEVMRLLLSKGAFIEAQDMEHFTPLLGAAWKGQSDAALYLLKSGADIEATDYQSKTCLHWSVEGTHREFVKMILENGGESLLGRQDKKDQTSVHYAAENGDAQLINILMSHGAKLDSKDIEEKIPLHIAAQYGRVNCVEVLANANPKQINEDDVDGRTPLLLASLYGHYKVVIYLLKIGADLSSRDDSRMSALTLACSQGHMDTALILIKNHADIDAVDKNKNSALHHSAGKGYADVTMQLLSKGADVTLENENGQNALEVAIDNIQEDTARVIVEHESWQKTLVARGKNGYTPLKSLIEKLPDVALNVLDKCVTYSNPDKTVTDLKVTYDYKYIDTDPATVDTNFRWNALSTMIECGRESLVSHELSQQILKLKWRRFVRYFFALDFITYTIFLVSLTLYAAYNPLIATPDLNADGCPNTSDFYNADGSLMKQNYNMVVLEIVIALFCVIQVFKEVFEFFNQKLQYFLDYVNYTELGLYTCSFIFVHPIFEKPCAMAWRAGACAIFLAWITFILYVRRFDLFGIYVVMFFSVLKSLMKAIIVFILFAFAFGTAFFILFSRLEVFGDMPSSVMKVIVMTLGELDYTDIFYAEDLAPFDVTAHVLFVIFIFLMPIVLMNLLVGIAVGDIDKVQKNAYLEKIEMDVDFIERIETNVPKVIQKCLYVRTETDEPNKNQDAWWMKISKILVRHQKNEEAIETEKNRDRTNEKLDRMQHQIDSLCSRQRSMNVLLEQQSDLMKLIGNKMDVNAEEDEYMTTQRWLDGMYSELEEPGFITK
ncbi:transient receptor potential cation channel subfamily A member 1-like [Saccoglossus kowalevskii]|uniref:Transient receptor potential cation channel subfamily A member 1-like n=1 Tax=Saccoglossus kowalevskii TaxID=10224 RepID=A0ABM0H0K5_SACKO|nr:PREDICTED: transient receptor potential cation channel subfamily A member 1-like [Saccoglossus kowalevskii]